MTYKMGTMGSESGSKSSRLPFPNCQSEASCVFRILPPLIKTEVSKLLADNSLRAFTFRHCQECIVKV